jgi:hypothetical protein
MQASENKGYALSSSDEDEHVRSKITGGKLEEGLPPGTVQRGEPRKKTVRVSPLPAENSALGKSRTVALVSNEAKSAAPARKRRAPIAPQLPSLTVASSAGVDVENATSIE